jgi:hypothetical protein
MSNDARIAKITAWIDKVNVEINDLFLHHHIFWEIQTIIDNSPRLSATASHFFQWMGMSFVHTSAMVVRRQLDTTSGTVSFIRLLEELRKTPLLITRDYVVEHSSFWQALSDRANFGNEMFNRMVGIDKNHLERGQIKADEDKLKEKAKLIIDYANQYIAHFSEKPYSSCVPKFYELDDCMNTLETLLQKYYFLIKGIELPKIDIASSFVYDWKEIFTFPWIDTGC